MKFSLRNALPIVLLPALLAVSLTVLIGLLALGLGAASRERGMDAANVKSFTITVPGDNPELAQRLQETLSEWLKQPEPPHTPAVTAEIKRSPAGQRSGPRLLEL